MIASAKGFILLIAIGLTITAGIILADEPTETDITLGVTEISDTTLAVFARALINQDTTLLVSVFPENIQIAMPRGKSVIGQEKIARYAPLIFDKFGGCEMTYKRLTIEFMAYYGDLVREVGTMELIRHAGDQADTIWDGAYNIYWQLADSTWIMERIFLGRK